MHAQACTEQLMCRLKLMCGCLAVCLEQQMGRQCPPALRGVGPDDFDVLQLWAGPPALPGALHEPSHCLKPLQTPAAAGQVMMPGSIVS